MRRLNVRIAVPADGAGGPRDGGAAAPAGRWRWTSSAGWLVTLVGLLVLGTLLETLGWIPFREQWTRPALALSAAAALASSLRLFGRRRMPLFAAGAAAGAVLLWLR